MNKTITKKYKLVKYDSDNKSIFIKPSKLNTLKG